MGNRKDSFQVALGHAREALADESSKPIFEEWEFLRKTTPLQQEQSAVQR